MRDKFVRSFLQMLAGSRGKVISDATGETIAHGPIGVRVGEKLLEADALIDDA